MDTNDRQAIEALFEKLGQAERSDRANPRDPEAEALIRERMTRQTGAAYYMAQTIVVQEHALHAAHERIEDLQRELSSRPAAGGFLASLFGGGQPPSSAHHAPRDGSPAGPGSRWNSPAGPGENAGPMSGAAGRFAPGHRGFLAGAAQTAMGVAGGVVLGGLIGGALSAGAGGSEQPPGVQQAAAEPRGSEEDLGLNSEAA
ncbi:MAG: FIG00987585: hypothetical protein [uncultured Microvirga sp.]|uniref:DUF2076 domain-containing protein n=1 Tax=uncultured Microvirga sp. TaxID=412392 RepID=A0A6J4MAA7_9HYPH|nr:MAG: FIG00987585: hypothetical protein [uncultured Microvirga sp.]